LISKSFSKSYDFAFRDQPIIKLLLELAWQRPEQGFGRRSKVDFNLPGRSA